jgi:hypothetical protein
MSPVGTSEGPQRGRWSMTTGTSGRARRERDCGVETRTMVFTEQMTRCDASPSGISGLVDDVGKVHVPLAVVHVAPGSGPARDRSGEQSLRKSGFYHVAGHDGHLGGVVSRSRCRRFGAAIGTTRSAGGRGRGQRAD